MFWGVPALKGSAFFLMAPGLRHGMGKGEAAQLGAPWRDSRGLSPACHSCLSILRPRQAISGRGLAPVPLWGSLYLKEGHG